MRQNNYILVNITIYVDTNILSYKHNINFYSIFSMRFPPKILESGAVKLTLVA